MVVFTALVVGILFQFYLRLSFKFLICMGAIVLIFTFFYRPMRFAIFLLVGMIIFSVQFASLTKIDGDVAMTKDFEGIASSVSVENGNFGKNKVEFTLKLKKSGDILVSYYGNEYNSYNFTGQKVKVYGELLKPTTARNPKCFDYRKYLYTNNIGYQLKAEKIRVENAFDNIYLRLENKICNIRDEFIRYMEQVSGKETTGFIKAMMFGIKDNLDDETYESFQKNGTAHILATSGLHIGIIYAFFSKVFHIGRSKFKCLLTAIFFIVYEIMADCSFSVLRAVILILISMGGKLFHRKVDLLTSLSFAGLILLFISPMAIFNAGFQMSFLAVFILGVTMPRYKNSYFKNMKIKDLLPVFTIQLIMMPYIVYNFNYLSLTSFLANIPVTFLASYLLPMGMGAMIIYSFINFIPQIYVYSLNVVTKFLIDINNLTFVKGKLSFDVPSPSLLLMLGFYILFFIYTNEEIIISLMRKKYEIIAIVTAFLMSLNIFIYINEKSGFEKADMFFVDVGQGCCMLFKGKNGKALMIDGGGNVNYSVGEKTVKPFLLKNGIRTVDVAMATHLDNDHYLGLKELAQNGMIKKLALYKGNSIIEDKILRECNLKRNDMLYLTRGNKLKIDENLFVEIIAPLPKVKNQYVDELKSGDENARSLVAKVYLNDLVYLITGDIDIDTEEKLKGNLRCHVIQVPHHGSKDSSSDYLLNSAKPKVAVFQVGKNNYGHPSPHVIEKYKNSGIIINRNDTQGDIGFIFKDGNYSIVEMIKED